jgi:hypothetical protein
MKMSKDLVRVFVNDNIQITLQIEDFFKQYGLNKLQIGDTVLINKESRQIVDIKPQNEKTVLSDRITDLYLQ